MLLVIADAEVGGSLAGDGQLNRMVRVVRALSCYSAAVLLVTVGIDPNGLGLSLLRLFPDAFPPSTTPPYFLSMPA
jgi:hypothetical protein